MEMRLLLIALASACALCAGYVLATEVNALVRGRSMVLYARGQKPSLRALAALRLETGYGLLLPISKRFLAIKPVRTCANSLVESARTKGIASSAEALTSVVLMLSVITLVGIAVLTGSIVAGCAVVACCLAVLMVWSGGLKERRQNLMREEIPGVIELMTSCFGLGFTLLQTFQQIAANTSGQLGRLFGKAAHVLETGGSMDEALGLLRNRIDIPELAFVVAALEVQHQNGGAVTQVLQSAAQSVKSELALKRSLRVQTAQAKLSARVVIVMPFVLIALFSLISPGFLAPFFESFAGYALFGIALAMQAGGIALVHRTLDIEGLA